MINQRMDAALEARRVNRDLELGNGNDNEEMVNEDGQWNSIMEEVMKCVWKWKQWRRQRFKGTEGVVGLIRWSEKMETVFHISNCPERYQVKYATCTLLDIQMVLEEEDRVEKFIRGLPNNIQGNVIAAEPTRLQDAIRIANNLMDQ
ncbi:hypothetical protein Tco_0020512 [Tanacetum coccineum]